MNRLYRPALGVISKWIWWNILGPSAVSCGGYFQASSCHQCKISQQEIDDKQIYLLTNIQRWIVDK